MANIMVATENTFNPVHQDKFGVASGLFHWEGELKKSYWEWQKYYHVANVESSQISYMVGVIFGPEMGVGIGKDNANALKEAFKN